MLRRKLKQVRQKASRRLSFNLNHTGGSDVGRPESQSGWIREETESYVRI